MSKRWLDTAVLAFVVATSSLVISGQSPQRGRIFFDGSERFKRSIPIPEPLVRLLMADPEYRNCTDMPSGAAVNDWFSATKVHVGGKRVADVLVKGTCANSGNTYSFWIFARQGRGFQRIFFTSTLGIYLGRFYNGHREILAEGGTASGIFYKKYRYNGRRYVKQREWWNNLAAK